MFENGRWFRFRRHQWEWLFRRAKAEGRPLIEILRELDADPMANALRTLDMPPLQFWRTLVDKAMQLEAPSASA